MNLHYFISVVVWISSVTATLESDSHENWSNEKNESQQQFSMQVVQPYILPLKIKSMLENTSNESLDNISKLGRISQNVTNEAVTVQYIPSQEVIVQNLTTTKYSLQNIGSNDLRQINSEENIDNESIKEFGQRVRSLRSKNNENHDRFRLKQFFNIPSPSEDHRKHYRKNFHSYKKLNNSDNNHNAFSKDQHSFTLTKTTKLQRSLKQKETEEDYTDNPTMIKNIFTTTFAPIASVSLGKFSGPIVVPDFPQQKKYSYANTDNYTESNEVSKSTIKPLKSKVSENGYLAASTIILNPLQVGVALMNAGQDLNSVNDQDTSTKLYLQNETNIVKSTEIDSESLIQSDVSDFKNSSFQNDQISQQNSEVVVTNSPSQLVEIQKSVEIFHTAPIQEIHYPVEFVPNVQQPLVKQYLQEDYKKPVKNQFKDQKLSQINVYKNNEILDENISPNNQERNRYEYTSNENDVIYSANSDQINQTIANTHPVETKTTIGVKEQINTAQYDQIIIKQSRFQGYPETNVKQNNYEIPKKPISIVPQSRGIDNLSSLTNQENLQGTQELSQVLLTKVTSELPTEQKFLMSVPQSYSVEKNIHHPMEIIEKKVPFSMEKVIEKQITIPQPFPIHVPIDRVIEKQIRIPYPVHVEKVVEKKVPIAIQKFVIPLPIHFRVPQPIPISVEKVIEKSIPIPVPEKILPRPYSMEIEKNRPFSLENTKLVKLNSIYNVQGDYQQPLRQNFQSVEPYDNEQDYYNSTMQYYDQEYLSLNRPHTRQPSLIHILPKKFVPHGIQYPSHSVTYSMNNGNNLIAYGRISEKDKVKNEYMGPVPRKLQTSLGIQSKSLHSSSDIQTTLRRTRQEVMGNSGNFRQSKMEYGFKPPMVPSVQYDEQTATKVE